MYEHEDQVHRRPDVFYLCFIEGCERSRPPNEFWHPEIYRDHIKSVHGLDIRDDDGIGGDDSWYTESVQRREQSQNRTIRQALEGELKFHRQ